MATLPEGLSEAEQQALRPFIRLQQLVLEIDRAIEEQDFELLEQAVGLLAGSVEACSETDVALLQGNAIFSTYIEETQQKLLLCEKGLEQGMQRTRQEWGRLRKGQRSAKVLRPEPLQKEGSLIDRRE